MVTDNTSVTTILNHYFLFLTWACPQNINWYFNILITLRVCSLSLMIFMTVFFSLLVIFLASEFYYILLIQTTFSLVSPPTNYFRIIIPSLTQYLGTFLFTNMFSTKMNHVNPCCSYTRTHMLTHWTPSVHSGSSNNMYIWRLNSRSESSSWPVAPPDALLQLLYWLLWILLLLYSVIWQLCSLLIGRLRRGHSWWWFQCWTSPVQHSWNLPLCPALFKISSNRTNVSTPVELFTLGI